MAKDKKPWWGVVDPDDGDIVIVEAKRDACQRVFCHWTQILLSRLYSDIYPVDPKDRYLAGLTWKQAYRQGWRCVKVWVYQQPRVCPERFLPEIGHAYDSGQPMPKMNVGSTDGVNRMGRRYVVVKSAE